MAAVDIIKASKLTIEHAKDLSDEVIELLSIDTSDFDDDILATYDYVDWVVEISGNRYRFLHGFPGDNPIGVLVDKDDSSVVLATCGEGGGELKQQPGDDDGQEDAQTFLDWYESETTGVKKYKKIFYASALEKRSVSKQTESAANKKQRSGGTGSEEEEDEDYVEEESEAQDDEEEDDEDYVEDDEEEEEDA